MKTQLNPGPAVSSAERVTNSQIADWPTVWLLIGCSALWGAGMLLSPSWGVFAFLCLTLALALHSSLTHEILHGHPFQIKWLNDALGLIQPGLLIPYLRFKRLHLAHHRDARLTDPYDDPETNYLDPAVWAKLPRWSQTLLLFNNTLLGRMMIGPVVGMISFVRADWKLVRRGDRQVLGDWALHVPGCLLVLWVVSAAPVSVGVYLAACYAAQSLLKIRTFLEHRAHSHSAARTVIIEDRGFLAFLFLNNNLHVVHHMHPNVPWYRLPALYRRRRAKYLARNDGYVYRSYAQVFRQHLLRRKDPVAHPLWPQG